jgi:hypothetical protein
MALNVPLIIRNACLHLNRAFILDFVRDAKWCPGLDRNRKSIEQPGENKRQNQPWRHQMAQIGCLRLSTTFW